MGASVTNRQGLSGHPADYQVLGGTANHLAASGAVDCVGKALPTAGAMHTEHLVNGVTLSDSYPNDCARSTDTPCALPYC